MNKPAKNFRKTQVILKLNQKPRFSKKRSASTKLIWERREMVRQTLLLISSISRYA